jgi:hypothetical protein
VSNANTQPEHPPDGDYSSAVIDYFLDRQANDPQFVPELAKKLWDNLSPEERAQRYIDAGELCTDGAPERWVVISSLLILNHINQESELAHKLDRQFEDTFPPNTETTA